MGGRGQTKRGRQTQEHILLEYGHPVDTFVTEAGSEGMVSMEVLFKGTALDCTVKREMSVKMTEGKKTPLPIPICTERSGKDRDIAEATFKRFVCSHCQPENS